MRARQVKTEAGKAMLPNGAKMQELDETYHGQRCRVYTTDFVEPIVGVVSIARPAHKMIVIQDQNGKQHAIFRTSIKAIELDEPETP